MKLRESDVDPDPIRQFSKWFEEAITIGVIEPHSMALATSTPDGRPSVRIVLLRGCDERGFAFFTNYESRKAIELEANPRAALALHWHELERQVRIEGRVERVSAAESDAYFQTRPAGSRLGAWASRQSEVIAGRESLEARYEELADPLSRRRGSPPRELGRVPGRSRCHRVLARAAQPVARSAAVHAGGATPGSSSDWLLEATGMRPTSVNR